MKCFYALVVVGLLGAPLFGMDAESLARDAFEKPWAMSEEQLCKYVQEFPDCLTWKHGICRYTLLHFLVLQARPNLKMIRLALGLGSDLSSWNGLGRTVQELIYTDEVRAIFKEYERRPWTVDPDTEEFTYNDAADDRPDEYVNPFAQTPVRIEGDNGKSGWFGNILGYCTKKNLVITGISFWIMSLAWKKYWPLVSGSSKA